ncbi:zinc finger and SCAN domain-containing protein 30-like [Rhineura floridana]|uniref:zinc finger and SCAN domain-containing protein 30-like n=1 Tax=Rhineura floridana TaxID=261503 RepID=UPI002AC85786|nr:zinc finger and SCAN domain-containing protein 30-like [Rhineura floridana]XP_061475778.1 zinc finger and SCAN domain-containing protein 30-like [Rhineura floridana]XP_061475779.1 zinc finger and SCAN domain-containing protein 30-like [Rhineura floridana]XP_061475780.1 zinc finger and SCAN domain-containing protein 30-like [Rhineura floridana]XP_061475781.1 zinc finger and SCAN domain-containing protein 30-like [Rhineura floridana]
MQRLQSEGQKEIKMEMQDPNGPEKGENSEVGKTDLHVVQVGTSTEFLAGMTLKQIKQEPEEAAAAQQCWEAKWQEFLKTMQAPCLGWRPLQLPPPHSEKEFWTSSFKEASLWPRGEHLTPTLSGLSGKATQEAYRSGPDALAKVKEEMPEEEPISLETCCQRFRQFCYWEVEGPREVCRQLQGLCCEWLKPERHSKEQILELVTLEQFLRVLPQEMQSWVREGCPQTCTQAVALAEDFLLRLKRREGLFQELEPFEQVMVNSPKAEQDPSDTEEMQLSMGVEQDGDEEANLLSDGQLSDKEEGNCRSEGPEQAEATRMPRKKAREKLTQDSLFVSESENKEQNLQTERAKKGSEISLERARETLFQAAERPGSQQQVEQPQEDPLGKILRKNFDCREEAAVTNNESPSQERNPEEAPEKTAEECGKSFRWSLDLAQPAKAQSYECSYCGKRWPCLSQLRRHVKIHTGERPHKCTDCGKSFSTSSNLSQHKRVHTGERPYSCKDCGKSYRRRASLVQHERETCQKGSHLNTPAVGYVVLGNCTLLCMKKSSQGGRNRMIAPKGGEAPLAAQPLNILTGYAQERTHSDD